MVRSMKPQQKEKNHRQHRQEKMDGNTEEDMTIEYGELMQWFATVKFRKSFFGGVNEAHLWKKLEELSCLLNSAMHAERSRYEAQLDVYKKAAASSIVEYKNALEQKKAECERLKQQLAQTEDAERGRSGA